MMSRGREGMAAARREAARAAAEAQQVLAHFVEGFEWKIPTRFELRDAVLLPREQSPRRQLVYGVGYPAPTVRTGPGLLEGFIKLQTARDESILAYARRWGPLWLCDHDLPYGHNSACEPYFDKDLQYEMEEDEEGEIQNEDGLFGLTKEELARLSPAQLHELEDAAQSAVTWWYGEELSAWRDLSRQVRATIRIARRLQDGQKPDLADWDALPFLPDVLHSLVVRAYEDTFNPADQFRHEHELVSELVAYGLPTEGVVPHEKEPRHASDFYEYRVYAVGRLRLGESNEFRRRALAGVLNYWLRVGRVRPRLEWTASKPEVQLGGNAVMGALAVQMLFDCSRTDGLAVCASCGTPFLPGPRRPRRDRNIYCSDCGTRAAARDAAARYRQTAKYRATYGKWRRARLDDDETC